MIDEKGSKKEWSGKSRVEGVEWKEWSGRSGVEGVEWKEWSGRSGVIWKMH